MKYVETYKTREKASEKQRLLADKGIKSRVLVDPMEGFAPALSSFFDVALVVAPELTTEAQQLLKKAG
jgi:hypothetical protein